MIIQIEGYYTDNEDFYGKSLNLRKKIFVDELGFDKHLEFDGKDKEATHYIVLLDGVEVGVARWLSKDSMIRIDRFGIDKAFRARGLGLLLIKFVKDELIPSGKKIEIVSTDDNTVFFIQQGFKDTNQIGNFGKKKIRILSL